MKIKLNKAWRSIVYEEKIPRKTKKWLFGRKLNKSKLQKLIKSVTLGSPIKTMYERRDIKPYAFCPNCGCTHYIGTGNMTVYPEHWENFHCIRCKKIVATIDNSPFIHELENINQP